ncbi:MAG: hypothetical protein IJK42_15475 [Prevotella sp.]|nr:hypothetical protein [Prevotella sp.]
MKKYFYLLALALFAIQFQSCSNDDETESTSELEKNYLSIENAIYNNGSFPTATTEKTLDGIDMSTQVMNGAMNYISIITEKNIQKFFIGVKGVPGFWEYALFSESTRAATGYNTYVIPVMMSQSYSGNSTIVLSGQLDNGDVMAPIEKEVFYIETMPGEIEVKLAFSNSKDVDLHLYTPNGEHIYYGNRGGTYTMDNGEEISYGLDIDSNAGCTLDHVNKENIYIPSELVESGTYIVVVDMYQNCETSVPTNWSIVARYQGELITPTSGHNPASGIYPTGAGNGDMTRVMTFTIDEESSTRSAGIKRFVPRSFKPTPLTDMDEMKIEETEYRIRFAK